MDSKRKTDTADASLAAKKAKLDVPLDDEEIDPMSAWERPKPPPINPATYALGSLWLLFSTCPSNF